MIDEYVHMEMSDPARTYWAFEVPKRTSNVESWKNFVMDILGNPAADTRTGDTAKKAVKNWCLEYDLLESDTSMLEE